MGGPVDECCPPNDSAGLNPSSHWSEMPRSTYALDNAVQGEPPRGSWRPGYVAPIDAGVMVRA
jgi:hypothetical protein